MKTYALIGKFIGIWMAERDLLNYIAIKWKPKAHFNLQLGSKGFFTIIFSLLEDRDRILEGGPYFFYFADLFLKKWIECFNLDTEHFSWESVWVFLYSLPRDYWDEEKLMDIDNSLGEFVKIADQMRQQRYTSYARICLYAYS